MTKQNGIYEESQIIQKPVSITEQWVILILCALVIAAGIMEELIPNRSTEVRFSNPVWLPFAAAVIAAIGIIQLNGRPQWLRAQQILRWSGLFLLIWTANGLPLDLLRLTPLMPPGLYWPGMVTKILAFATVVMLVRVVLKRPADPASTPAATWYAYAAFLLALPYPVLRTIWAMGGSLGLTHPGAAGEGWEPWLISIPWIMAAILSLLLITPRPRIPRRLLLTAGWCATAIVAMIGPTVFWVMISTLAKGKGLGIEMGILGWVPCLFYSSWFLWAIAGGAATRSYQVRSLV